MMEIAKGGNASRPHSMPIGLLANAAHARARGDGGGDGVEDHDNFLSTDQTIHHRADNWGMNYEFGGDLDHT